MHTGGTSWSWFDCFNGNVPLGNTNRNIETTISKGNCTPPILRGCHKGSDECLNRLMGWFRTILRGILVPTAASNHIKYSLISVSIQNIRTWCWLNWNMACCTWGKIVNLFTTDLFRKIIYVLDIVFHFNSDLYRNLKYQIFVVILIKLWYISYKCPPL